MRIGLVDVDGHNFPNLALMKLSAWHKKQGDVVEWAFMDGRYDILYKSKVFTFSDDDEYTYGAQKVIRGGTGYLDYETVLPEEVEHIYPDYGLYGITDTAYGFVTRGCINHCSFCVVPKKEGMIRKNAMLFEFWKQGKQSKIVLLDNNILAHPWGINQLGLLSKWGGAMLDCNQGLDARLIADDIALQKMLGKIRWTNDVIRLACDSDSQIEPCRKAIAGLRCYSERSLDFSVYTLLYGNQENCLRRINILRDMSRVYPFAQPYRSFTNQDKVPDWQKDIARWCNMRATFRSCTFDEYKKGGK